MPPQDLMTSSPAPNGVTHRAVLQKRHLAVHFPQLPLDLWRRREDVRLVGAFGITAKASNTERLICVNTIAGAAGVKPGQSLTDAAAICPDLLTQPQDSLREARLLSALQRWADKFSPRVGQDAPDGLALDITGCAHLLGGEDALGLAMLKVWKTCRSPPVSASRIPAARRVVLPDTPARTSQYPNQIENPNRPLVFQWRPWT